MSNSLPSTAAHQETDSRPMDRRLLGGWIAMVVGMFLAVLDIQIVASSLTDIQAGLAASPDEISWIQTAYLIAEIIMIPLSGFLARMWGSRRLFLVSAVGFTLASFACAFAWSIESLIVMRIFQGFIGGGMIPCVFASIYMIFPPSKHSLASVVVGMIVTCAPAIGPTLGGFITELLSWHWLFLINVLPGIAVIWMVALMPDFDRADSSLAKGFDVPGVILMALFLGGMEFVLDEGPRDDWFEENVILFWTVVSGIAAVLFLWRCFHYRQPIVELRVLGNRNFALGCLISMVMGLGLFGGTYITPLFLARVQGYNAFQIGTVMSVTGIFMFLTAPFAGKLQDVVGPRVVLLLGTLLAVGGFTAGGFLNNEAGIHELFWSLALRGIGLVSMIISLNAIALGTLPVEQLSNASGLYNLSRNLGGAIGLAAINTLLDQRFFLHHAHLADWLNPARPEFQQALQQAQMAGLAASEKGALAIAQMIAAKEALVMTFNDVHLVISLAFAVTCALVLLVSKPSHAVVAAH